MKRGLSGLLILTLLCAGVPTSTAAGGDPDANRVAGAAFLLENKGKPGVVTTDSGLQYLILVAGAGPRPTPTSTVTVHYRGTLVDGTEFDSSYSQGESASFPLDQVIPGWTEALQLMSVGSIYRLFIPPELAYGERGAGLMIGPNAMLLFEIELLATEP
jgi:FKBP-type peptidyl-prolyl cis-trans isomerase